MVNFRLTPDDRRPPNYMARRTQRQLLLLVLSLGFVLLLMSEAAKPKNWAWMWWMGSGQATTERAAEPFDNVLRPADEEQLPLDTFVSPAPQQDAAADADHFAGVNAQYLRSIKEHTVFRNAEHDAWFNLLDVLQESDPAEIEKGTTGPVGVVQLSEQPRAYRGRLVSVEGVVRRCFPLTAPRNDLGIERYHRLWLEPAGGPASPIVIYCLDLPDGFPVSRETETGIADIHEEIALTGFFFKNWAYAAPGQIRTAPLLLARNFAWSPPPPVAPLMLPPWRWLALLLGGTALVGVIVAWLVYRSSLDVGGSPAAQVAARYGDIAPAMLAEGDDPDAIARSLAELAAEAEPSAPADEAN